jgi:KipI family sensor histidine kinase inhibitor
MGAHVITMPVQVAPAGDRGVLVTFDDAISASELHARARGVEQASGLPPLRCIPGHSSLLLIFEREPDLDAVWRALEEGNEGRPEACSTRHSVRVSFAEGPDLDEFLAHTRQSREEFVRRIAEVRLTARYLGFRAGFAYLDGWPEEWAMPRRPTSRPHVPRGSFAVAGAVAAFYPIDTPGGWNLLGRTDAVPRIEPGDEIVIEPTLERLDAPPVPQEKPRLSLDEADVLAAPLAMLVTTPFDEIAAAIANRAVGKDADAPLLECAIAGPRLRFRRSCVTAWCGPDAVVHLRRVSDGEEVAFGKLEGGLRGYLAMGEAVGVVARIDRGDRRVIRAWAGPHDVGIRELVCEVTPRLDRVGIRLRPLQPVDVAIPGDLRSSGMQFGTVQLHPDGSVVAMGPDHPVTGGYLQPMTVITSERWKLAQLVPGERVTFVAVQPPY